MKKLFLLFFGFCLAFAGRTTALAQTITNQPQSITINNASSAMFTVGATNATSYQWQLNGSNLTDIGNITGSATATLMMENVATNQAGTYTVIVSNSMTSSNIVSSNAVLTLVPGTIVRFIFTNLLTNIFSSGTNYVDVELFNHDKPVTVENFLQYISSGAYTNMFMDRCVTNFVLQGGDYGTTDETNTNAPITGWFIDQKFTPDDTIEPPFETGISNEFNAGPQIRNTFGTIAMGLIAHEPNSASSAFFFNLNDNSSILDTTNNGPFVVFGRILDGSNVLNDFNGLTNGNGFATNGELFTDGVLSTTITNLPDNYTGTNAPANANLVYCTFQLTIPPSATNQPGIVITSPTADAVLSNTFPLTVQGIANDINNIGLAWVRCDLIPMAAADGTLPNGGVSLTNYILGATNWTLNFETVPPGMYELGAQVMDEASNLSPEVFVDPVIVSVVLINGNGTVTFTNGAFTNLNAVGYPFQDGRNYDLFATPGTNQLFVSWINGGTTIVNPEIYSSSFDDFLLTATFISNGIPNSIAFTYPASNGVVSTNAFDITGTISNVAATPVTVTCHIYSTSTREEAAVSPLTNSGTTNWSVTVSNLPVGDYVVVALAEDSASNTTVISEDFTVEPNAVLTLNIIGPGTVSGATNGESILVGSTFEVAANPDPGQLFYTWNNSATGEVYLNEAQTNTMTNGLTLTATFFSNTLPNNLAFTAPSANVVLSNGTVRVSGTISNVPSPPVTVTCQIFSQTSMVAVSPPLTTSGTSNWSVIVSNLAAGSYIAEVLAVDQASNSTVITESFNATVDTNAPAISILSPATNAILTDNNSVAVSGTASDNLGLVVVTCYLAPTNAADGASPNGGKAFIDNAVGTTNWSFNFGIVPPGVYTLEVLSLDNVGNIGQQTQIITNTGILINGNGSVSLTQNGVAKPNPVGYPLLNGVAYQIKATPGAGQAFAGWSAGSYTTTNPVVTFTNSAGLLWTATFVPSNSGKGISFTYPTANARLITNTFLLKGRLTVSFESARVSCQVSSLTTSFTVGPLLATSGSTTWSAAVSNLPPDNYMIEAMATNAAGASAIISEKFSIDPFTLVAGTYTGLFICTNNPVAPTNSGFLSFTLEPSGLFSGRLAFPAFAPVPIYSLLFQNNYFTTGYFEFTASENVPERPLSMAIYLDLSGGSDYASGTISSTGWSSQLTCYREVTKLSTNTTPAPGKYVFSLQAANQTNGPYTNGYVSATIAKTGTVALSGVLPDNTTFSQSARVSKEGVWPIYAAPAGDLKNGLLMGWETFTNSTSSTGQLFWYKARFIGPYYTGGIGLLSNMLLNATGTNFLRPANGSKYSIIFQGGSLSTPVTNNLEVSDTGQFVVIGGPSDKLKISLSASGVITGSIYNLRFKGAFIGPSQGGSGFIPDFGGETGSFQLEPVSQ